MGHGRPIADHLNDLVIVPDDVDVLSMLDHAIDRAMRFRAIKVLFADDECEHGRLPTDGGEPCGCWGTEGAPAPAGAGREHDQAPEHECSGCGATFRRIRDGATAHRKPYCPTCVERKVWLRGGRHSIDNHDGTETLRCEACGGSFVRKRSRGRKPRRCPTCRDPQNPAA
jgi:hypothetical protein